jgi:hypothetical protein
MCNAASDGDRYSGRTEPAEVSGGHGVGVAAAASFLCVSHVRCDHKAKTQVLSKHRKHAASPDIGHNYAVNGPIYKIRGYKWIAKKV